MAERTRLDSMSDVRCDWHLDNWAAWMSERGTRLGFPSRASGRMGKSSSTDFDTMVRSADVRCAVAVDALVDGLPPIQRASVYAMKLAERWPYAVPLEDVFTAALQVIARALTRRGIM